MRECSEENLAKDLFILVGFFTLRLNEGNGAKYPSCGSLLIIFFTA